MNLGSLAMLYGDIVSVEYPICDLELARTSGSCELRVVGFAPDMICEIVGRSESDNGTSSCAGYMAGYRRSAQHP